VPTDAGIDDRHPRILQRLREQLDFVPRATIADEIEHAQPEDDYEIPAARRARLPHDVHGEPHPVREVPTVLVGTRVRRLHEELIYQVPLRSHDLDAVVPCPPRQCGAIRVVAYRRSHPGRRQSHRGEGRYRTLRGRRRHREGVMRVPSGVEYLQAYPSRLGGGIGTAVPGPPRVRGDAHGVDRVGDDPVPIALLLGGELPGEGPDPAASVRRDATGDFFRGGAIYYMTDGDGRGAERGGCESSIANHT